MGSKKSSPAPAPTPAPVQEVIVTDRAAKGSNEVNKYTPSIQADDDKKSKSKKREKMGSAEPASAGLSVG